MGKDERLNLMEALEYYIQLTDKQQEAMAAMTALIKKQGELIAQYGFLSEEEQKIK